jgi:uncharacterized protein
MPVTFAEEINSRERLRELIKPPSRKVSHKAIDHIDELCARFIAASPFVVLATRGGDRRLDLSPKGDPPGFVAVVDRKTLLLPDRLGNNRADSFENLLVHPEVALLFLIPGLGHTLRVSGTAKIVVDPHFQRQLAVNGREPQLLVAVAVDEAFMHCQKCMIRSNLWQPQAWPDVQNVPTLAEAMVSHGKLSDSISEIQTIIESDRENRLY